MTRKTIYITLTCAFVCALVFTTTSCRDSKDDPGDTPLQDSSLQDSSGQDSAGQGAVQESGGEYTVLVGATMRFEDVGEFSNGLAPVSVGGKWGFIDRSGKIMIAPSYEDALSFSGHLAAVKQGDYWGYLALTNKFGIEPQFTQAKTFQNGSAPVLTDAGWQIISLVEFSRGAGLF